jgi:hypothetical protein
VISTIADCASPLTFILNANKPVTRFTWHPTVQGFRCKILRAIHLINRRSARDFPSLPSGHKISLADAVFWLCIP